MLGTLPIHWLLFHLLLCNNPKLSDLHWHLVCSWFCSLGSSQWGQLVSVLCDVCLCWDVHDSFLAHSSDTLVKMAHMVGSQLEELAWDCTSGILVFFCELVLTSHVAFELLPFHVVSSTISHVSLSCHVKSLITLLPRVETSRSS